MGLMHNIFVQFLIAVVIAVTLFVGTLAAIDTLMQVVQAASAAASRQARPAYEVDFSAIKYLNCKGPKCKVVFQ